MKILQFYFNSAHILLISPTHEVTLLTKFHNDCAKIVEFLLVASFGLSLVFFAPVSIICFSILHTLMDRLNWTLDSYKNVFKIKCPGCFTVSWYTFWDTIFFDEKSIIHAILRYMGHPKCN